jgi:hypothetical protein
MRVVLYAEGTRELYGELILPRAPRSPLAEDDLGAAHVLVRRAIGSTTEGRGRAVQFEEPLRLSSNQRPPRGSDLLDRKNLRRLLTWSRHPRPDLAIVLVDEDGDEERRDTVKAYLEAEWSPPVVIGVAVREFESWLITDLQAVRSALDIAIDEPQGREGLEPGEAKKLLDGWIETSGESNRGARVRIAQELQLEALTRGSRSFRRFQEELGATLARVP